MNLCIPETVLNQHVVWLGKTRAGKSSAMRHVVEWLLHKKKRVCVVDPKGDWYGLRASADGKGPGFEVVLFGDFKDGVKSDVPLIPRSQLDNDEFDTSVAAKHVAELVSSGNRPCVIGMRGWTQGAMTRFWIDFASTVFNRQSGELYLTVDEIHNFAPKGKLMGMDSRRALHWANRLLNEGAGIGIINLIASQRPQKVHNDTLTACETLCAMRVVHKADRDAVTNWIQGCGDQNVTAESLRLAEKPRGTAVVWSPEIRFGPQDVKFPLFTTFDSFAPQKFQRKISEKGWATVDLTEVRERLARVIEQTKAEDPAELRKTISTQQREITSLTRQLESKVVTSTATVKTKSVHVVDDRHVTRLQKIMGDSDERITREFSGATSRIDALLARQRTALQEVQMLLKKRDVEPARTLAVQREITAPSQSAASVSSAPRASMVSGRVNDGDLSKMERTMLIALAQHPNGLTKSQILLHTGYAASGPTSKAFASLVAKQYAEAKFGNMYITGMGEIALGGFEPLPTGLALQQHLLKGDKLTTMEKALLRVICEAHPNAIAKRDVLKSAGYANSGPVSRAFARLVRYGYAISSGTSLLRASEVLFDKRDD